MVWKQRSAAGSPSVAAWVITGPEMPSGTPLAQLQQPDGAARGAPGELAGLGDQGVPAAVLLPAAPVPAPAQPPVGDYPDVPGLAGDPPPSAVELAADEDGRADTGAQRHQHHVAVPARGPEPGFGPGGGVRVVLHHDLAAETLLDPLLQRLVAPGEVRREQHGRPGAVDEPGRAQPDRRDPVAGREELGHRVGDRLLGPRRAGRRGRSLQFGDDPAVFVDNPRRDFRATDINADGQRH